MELDNKNKFLFEHLLAYARFSVKDLAKALKVSKATIIKRLTFLENEAFISRYDAIVNWQKINLIKKVYFVKVFGGVENFEREIKKNAPVFSLIKLSGLYNYQVWCFFKNTNQQKEFEARIKKFAYKHIRLSQLVFPRVSFFDIPIKIPFPKINDSDLKLGKIDIAIMKHMAQGNARQSLFEMSKTLNLPYDTVHYHAKNLMKAGYFLSLIAQPGENQFTLQTTSLFIQCNSKASTKKLFDLLHKTPKVISVGFSADNKVLVHFLSQTHLAYRKTLDDILSLILRKEIKSILLTHWNKILLNNRYPLEFLL